ncbi:MAG TPA: hypothetical protein VGR54_04020 [Nitrosopumilaceae archaeon]|nr:hypothetical protein [Nitrosopumilaceae archaeon]
MVKVKLDGYLCQRCYHAWYPRDNEEPRVCPKCKSPYWNRSREGETNDTAIQAWESLKRKEKRN